MATILGAYGTIEGLACIHKSYSVVCKLDSCFQFLCIVEEDSPPPVQVHGVLQSTESKSRCSKPPRNSMEVLHTSTLTPTHAKKHRQKQQNGLLLLAEDQIMKQAERSHPKKQPASEKGSFDTMHRDQPNQNRLSRTTRPPASGSVSPAHSSSTDTKGRATNSGLSELEVRSPPGEQVKKLSENNHSPTASKDVKRVVKKYFTDGEITKHEYQRILERATRRVRTRAIHSSI